jgi:putative addiction module killer protein
MVDTGHGITFSGSEHESGLDVRQLVYLITHMFEVRQTEIFASWLGGLTDIRATARIDIRLRRLSLGNMGDTKSLGEGLIEMRIDDIPGYRLYFSRRGERIVILLCGGDKKRQGADSVRARQLLKDLGDDT